MQINVSYNDKQEWRVTFRTASYPPRSPATPRSHKMDSEYCLLREERNLVRMNSQHILVFHVFGGSLNHGPPRAAAGSAGAVTVPLVTLVISCNQLTLSVISVPLIRGVTFQVIVFWVVTPRSWRNVCLSDYKVSHPRRPPL